METNNDIVMCEGQPSFLKIQNELMGMHTDLVSVAKTVNFTQTEKHFLVNLINKRRDVLIDKVTFGQTKQYKKEEWDELSVEYNASFPQGHPYRNSKQLRKCWENMKTRYRKLNPDCVDPLSEIMNENQRQNELNDSTEKSLNIYKIKTSEEFPTTPEVQYHWPASMTVTSYSSTTDSQPRISSIHSAKTLSDEVHDLAAPTADESKIDYDQSYGDANSFETGIKSEVIDVTDTTEGAGSSTFFTESFMPISSNHMSNGLMVNRNRSRPRGAKNTLLERNSTRSKFIRKNNSGFRIGSISNRLMGRNNFNQNLPNIRSGITQESALEAKLMRMRIREADARVQLLKQRMRNASEIHEANLLLLRKKSAFYEVQAQALRDGRRIDDHFSSSDELDAL